MPRAHTPSPSAQRTCEGRFAYSSVRETKGLGAMGLDGLGCV